MTKLFKYYIILLLLLVTSCANKKNVIIEEKDENTLYSLAMQDFKNGFYNTAAMEFEDIENKFIFTPIAKKSIIMAIYSYYKAHKYDEVLRLTEYYKKINFGNEYDDYVLYIDVLSKYKKVIKAKKDLFLMNELLLDMNDLITYSINEEYKKDITKKRDILINYIIKNELLIYKFYINDNNIVGAINHLKTILERFPNSSYTPEILYKLIMLYKHINYTEGINKYYNILKIQYSNTKWYKYVNK